MLLRRLSVSGLLCFAAGGFFQLNTIILRMLQVVIVLDDLSGKKLGQFFCSIGRGHSLRSYKM